MQLYASVLHIINEQQETIVSEWDENNFSSFWAFKHASTDFFGHLGAAEKNCEHNTDILSAFK